LFRTDGDCFEVGGHGQRQVGFDPNRRRMRASVQILLRQVEPLMKERSWSR
jgi:hypothetical protein